VRVTLECIHFLLKLLAQKIGKTMFEIIFGLRKEHELGARYLRKGFKKFSEPILVIHQKTPNLTFISKTQIYLNDKKHL
jgi:hypothetical protein